MFAKAIAAVAAFGGCACGSNVRAHWPVHAMPVHVNIRRDAARMVTPRVNSGRQAQQQEGKNTRSSHGTPPLCSERSQ